MASQEDESLKNLDEEFYKSLLFQSTPTEAQLQPQGYSFTPLPGFIVKLKSDKNEKIFINVCQAEQLPEPKNITEEDLIKLLESPDASQFRVPMSIGESHAEVDKKGQGCTVFDVVINPRFYKKINSSNLFHGFFMTVVLEGLENKYDLTLSRDWIILKNRKTVGTLQPHMIRAKSKPFIMDMGESLGGGTDKPSPKLKNPPTQPVPVKPPAPRYSIVQEPPDGYPEFLVIDISLPGVRSMHSSTLDVGEDRLLLKVEPTLYYLDIDLDFLVDTENTGAQYNKKTKVLTVTLPVLQAS